MTLNFIDGPRAGTVMEWSRYAPLYFYYPVPRQPVVADFQDGNVTELYTECYKYQCVAIGASESFYRYRGMS